MRVFLISTIALLFYSCKNNELRQNLKYLYATPISIPTDININYNGLDTVINDIFFTRLKYIIYVDSSACTSCFINKMYIWDELLKYSKLYKDKLKFYFIFYPANSNITNELLYTIKLNPINYPILIDEKGDFEKLNPHLPKNKAMHTFLLDENNNVILVGNPLNNKEVKKLFYKKTQELLSK